MTVTPLENCSAPPISQKARHGYCNQGLLTDIFSRRSATVVVVEVT